VATKNDKGAKPAKKTIIDVTHADSTPPSPNSKSVIVPSRPILKDPMVVEKPEADEPKAVSKTPEKDILPTAVTEPLSSDKPAKAPTVAELAESADQEDKPSAEKEPPAKTPAEPATEPDEPDKLDQAAVEAEAAQQTKHDEAVEKLVESKQYYLPIETIEKRRSKRFVALGILLSLLLIVAWADIALDSGILHLGGIKPVTHFFSN